MTRATLLLPLPLRATSDEDVALGLAILVVCLAFFQGVEFIATLLWKTKQQQPQQQFKTLIWLLD